jgi:hypothetical protein
MDKTQQAAAPGSGTSTLIPTPIPTYAELAADPEIAALLDFTPVPRQPTGKGTWTPALQREFIARLAVHGSPGKACEELGKDRTGVRKLYNSPDGASFAAAWDAAIALAEKRRREPRPSLAMPPSIDNRFRVQPERDDRGRERLPGQVMNEAGEWEDEASYRRRGEEAKDSICGKLVRARRLFLGEISHCPGKRAAFELLTELPVDWDLAAQGEPQPDEPWRKPRARDADQILTAESGWSWGEIGYGPDRMRDLRDRFDAYRAEMGLEPIDWDGESIERSDADA